MKKATMFATVLFVGAGATQVQAQQLNGSDTLFEITRDLLATGSCGTGLTYVGGGTGTGETAIVNNFKGVAGAAQEVAPMSRFLSANACAVSPATAQAAVFALDGLSIVRSALSQVSCNSVAFNAAEGNGFPVTDWRSVLQLLYGGTGGTGTAAACSSAARAALVSSWGNLFEGTCAGESCTTLRHAFRRDDSSGTTDTFKSLVGVSNFCNGSSFQDNDPLRTPCQTNQEVCGATGNLGVVLPVSLPSLPQGTANADAVVWPNTSCAIGNFAYAPKPVAETTCPNGLAPVVGQCLTPRRTGNSYDCVNLSNTNRPFGTPANIDGRVYNRIVRRADGTILAGASGAAVRNAFYRLHSRRVIQAGAETCDGTGTIAGAANSLYLDATRTIGCLAAANGCSVGFAGREVDQMSNTSILLVGGRAPTDANIRELLKPAPNPAVLYPISRKLYASTIKGFAGVSGAQASLLACFRNPAVIDPIVAANGFITLGQAPQTQSCQ